MHRKPKVSHGRLVRVGLNRLFIVIRSGGTQEDMHASDRKCLLERVARQDRKIRSVVKVRRCTGGSTDLKMLIPHCQEKLRSRDK